MLSRENMRLLQYYKALLLRVNIDGMSHGSNKQLKCIKGFIASGVTRAVYDLGNGYILKFEYATYYDHQDTNRREYDTYKLAERKGCEHLFAKIVYCDDRFLIAEKLDYTVDELQNKGNLTSQQGQLIRRKLESDIKKYLGFYIGDLHEQNIMKDSKGRYKAVDFGLSDVNNSI